MAEPSVFLPPGTYGPMAQIVDPPGTGLAIALIVPPPVSFMVEAEYLVVRKFPEATAVAAACCTAEASSPGSLVAHPLYC